MKHIRARFHLLALLAVSAVLATGCAGGMAGKAARLHVWSAGTSLAYGISAGQSMAMEIPGQGQMVMNTTSTMEFTVEATATPREFKLAVTDASISSDAAQMGGEIPSVEALIGLESVIRLDERGLITEATGLEGNAAVEELGGVASFTEELQSLFLYLPEGRLGPGVEWFREYSFPMQQSGMQMEMSAVDQYRCVEATTYEGVPAYRISTTSTIVLTGSGDQMGMPMDWSMSGTGETTMYVETGTGAVLMIESTGEMSGGISAGGMDIPVDMRLTSTVTQKK